MIRKSLAAILTALFVFPLILAAVLSISMITFVLDQNFYTSILQDKSISDAFYSNGFIENWISQNFEISFVSQSTEISQILKTNLPDDYFQEQVGNFVQSLFDFINGKANTFSPVINIAPVKVSLQGQAKMDFINTLIASLRVCGPDESPANSLENMVLCKPDNIPDDQIKFFITPYFESFVKSLPDEIPIETNLTKRFEEKNFPFFIPGIALPAATLIAVISICFLAGSFWLITSLIASDNWRSRLQWLGWMLLIPAAFVFLIGISTSGTIPAYWIRYGLERAQLSPRIFEIIRTVITNAIPRITSSIMMTSGIAGSLAIGFIFWGLSTSRLPIRKGHRGN